LPVRLWIDVEDLLEYARGNKRPSGIQRLAFEIYRTMQEERDAAELIQFVRHDIPRNSFRIIRWSEVADVFATLTDLEPAPPAARANGIAPRRPARRFIGRWLHRLAPELRPLVIGAVLAQGEAIRAWTKLVRAVWHDMRYRLRRQLMRTSARGTEHRSEDAEATGPAVVSFPECAAPGDILLVLGSPWSHPDYAALISAQRQHGLRFALLVYDLIPIRRPEWCDRGLVRLFREWFETVLPLSDFVFAISRATASDVETFAREVGIALPGRVVPIPIGTGFSRQPRSLDAPGRRLLPAGSYALFVSTIEARKNHVLLFRVWRRLLEEMSAETVPTLVFAGRVGWLVDDLMRQIANTDHLDGKLVVIEDPTDADLAELYRGCLFTLFPSLYEGWGLPVTESLAFGKPCIISDRTALPEAGGKLARTFDPDNLHDAYQIIRQTIEDPVGLARWEAEVRSEFRPVPWSATVAAILTGLRFPEQNDSLSGRTDISGQSLGGSWRDAGNGVSASGVATGR
jgi:glycosyltransferase involved in cell wall biosynthesis